MRLQIQIAKVSFMLPPTLLLRNLPSNIPIPEIGHLDSRRQPWTSINFLLGNHSVSVGYSVHMNPLFSSFHFL